MWRNMPITWTDMPHFFCKLLAPRPSFPFDMNESEKALMGEHATYWAGMCKEGAVLVYGPVMDSKRSEEHTSELQSRSDLVCRLLLEKKKAKRRLAYTSQTHTSSHHTQRTPAPGCRRD